MSITYWDWGLTPAYLLLFWLLMRHVLSKRLAQPHTQKYFLWGFWAKMGGAIAFCLIYEYYYGGGDNSEYYQNGKVVAQAFWENPLAWWQMQWLDSGQYTSITWPYLRRIWMFNAQSTWEVVRMAGLFEIFTFRTYIPTTLCFALFSYLGLWQIYRFFLRFYPYLYKHLALILFIPSMLFWSSGILKETITCGALGFFVSAVTKFFYDGKNRWRSFFMMLLMYSLIKDVKGITITAFLPGISLWIYLRYNMRIQNVALRYSLLGSSLLIALAMAALVGGNMMNDIAESEAFKEAQTKIIGFQGDHGSRSQGHGGGEASTYHLGETDLSSPLGLAKSFVPAVNVTLFRPYPWEAGKLVLMLSSVESMLFMLATAWVLLRVNPLRSAKKLLTNPEVLLCFCYSMLMGFVVGITSYNFGVLTRFKTPLLPFYVAMLIIIYYTTFRPKSTLRARKKTDKRQQHSDDSQRKEAPIRIIT